MHEYKRWSCSMFALFRAAKGILRCLVALYIPTTPSRVSLQCGPQVLVPSSLSGRQSLFRGTWRSVHPIVTGRRLTCIWTTSLHVLSLLSIVLRRQLVVDVPD